MKLVILGPNNYLSMRSYLFSGRTRLLNRIHPSIQSLIAFEQREQFRTVQNRSEQFRKDQDRLGKTRTAQDRSEQTKTGQDRQSSQSIKTERRGRRGGILDEPVQLTMLM